MADPKDPKAPIDPKKDKTDNPFADLDSLRLSQDFGAEIGVAKALVRVPVRRPTRTEFIRVRDDEAYRMETSILENKEERETFLVAPDVRDQLPGDWAPVRLVTCISRQGVVFLWPLKLTPADGRSNPWYDSAIEGARHAVDGWVKIAADMHLGAYQVYNALGDLPEPAWPEYTFAQLLEVAFRDRFIRDMNHPAIQRLLGYV
jgi:hypothetical protein